MREKALGKDHPEVATSFNNLAELLRTWKTGVSPEPLYRRALAIWESALGPDHPRLALGLGNLAAFYVTDGRTKEALRLQRRALSIRESALGPEHPDVAASLTVLGQTLRSVGKALRRNRFWAGPSPFASKRWAPAILTWPGASAHWPQFMRTEIRMKKPKPCCDDHCRFWRTHCPASHPETMACRAQLATVLQRNHQRASAAATMTSLRR